ncbi:MAG: hypothetical protein IJS59_03220 [Bacteroidaceae bacterium]|nr:hypothetical protein [Bacteroidaceae bacterium]
MEELQNNKRIARNSLILYFRMIVITIVSIYTTRITLQILGVEDFGIRNVIAGLLAFMGIITTAMVNAAQRFLAFELGKNDLYRYRQIFSMLINLFLLTTIIGILLFEIIGPYVISHFLTIPLERLSAAQCIFQLTIIDFAISTLVIPYTSAVIAYEKMDIFAFVSLLDACLKLAAVFLLYIIPFDKLIAIVFLTAIAHLLSNLTYVIFCRLKLEGCRYKLCWDKPTIKYQLSFIGWNLFGTTTSIMNVQGQAILLNIFFGPTINTAKAISDNVHTVVISFVSNFFMAVNPQIVKTYANGKKSHTKQLVLNSSRYSLYLILILTLPLIFNMQHVLQLWLGTEQVTPEMVLFSQWTLILCIAHTFEYPITQTVRATGDLKKYQIGTGLQTLLFIPVCYIGFKIGAPPITSMIILTAISVSVLFFRVWILSQILDIPIKSYYKDIVWPVTYSSAICSLTLYFTHFETTSFYILFLSLTIDVAVAIAIIFLLGTSCSERKWILTFISKRLKISHPRQTTSKPQAQ